jgi:formate hydrogenlyase subunit 4
MIEAANHLKLVLYLSLIACLFVPFGMAPANAGAGAWLAGCATYLGKIFVGAVVLGAWEVSIAKMRVFRVSEYLGGAFVFAIHANLLAIQTREVLQ